MDSLDLGRRLIFGLILIVGILLISSASASEVIDDNINETFTDASAGLLKTQDEADVVSFIDADEDVVIPDAPDVPDLYVENTVYVDSKNINDIFIDGALDEKYSNKTLIFSGKFENFGKLVVDKDNVTLLGMGSSLKNTVFDLSGENLTLKDFNIDLNSAFDQENDGAAILVSSNNVNLINLNINYIVPTNVEAYGVFGVGNSRNPIRNLRIINSTINFEGHNNNRDVYNCAIKLINCHDALIENNTILTSLPLRDVNFGAHGATLDSDYVMSIGLEGCDYFKIKGNTIISEVNKRPQSQYPTLDGILISQSHNSLIYNNTISMSDFVTQVGEANYLYGIDVYALTNLTVSKNNISIVTRGGKYAAGTAYPIQVSGPIDLVKINDNELYSFSNGPNIGVYSQNYYGSTALSVTNNRINVTGLAGVHEWALVAGIETQDSNSTIANNTIEVHSVSDVNVDDNIYGVSYRQKIAGNHSYNIQNNTVFSDGFKAVYLLDSSDFEVKNNLLVSFNENAKNGNDGFNYVDLNNHKGKSSMYNNKVIRAEDYFTSIGVDIDSGYEYSYTVPTNDKGLDNKVDGSSISAKDKKISYSYNPLISDSSNSEGKSLNPSDDNGGAGDGNGNGGTIGGNSTGDSGIGGIGFDVNGNGNSTGSNAMSLRDFLNGFIDSDTKGGKENTTSYNGHNANVVSNNTDATPSDEGDSNPMSESQSSESPSLSANAPSTDSSVSKAFEIDELKEKLAFIPSIVYVLIGLALLIIGFKRKKLNFN